MTLHHQSKRQIRYAVVGLGHIAQVAVLPAFENSPNSQLFALVSGDAEKLKKVGKKYELDHLYSYDDYGRALSNVDAVYLAVPNHLHREYAERAAAAGVHVLCEKPMAVTEQDCLAMVKAALLNRVKLMIAYRLHFEAGNLAAIALAETEKMGDLRVFTSEFSQQVSEGNVRVAEPASRGGGPVYDMGVYCINAVRHLFRAEPVELSATAASARDARFGRVEEMVSVVMRFPQERLATFTCSFGASRVSRYAVLGSRGSVRADPAYGYSKDIELEITIGGKTHIKTFPKSDQFAAELIYFSDCILGDKDPEPSGLEGLADVRIVEAIYESIRAKRTIPLLPLPVRRGQSRSQQIRRPAHAKPHIIHAHPPVRDAA